MPPQSTVTEIRFNNSLTALTTAVTTFGVVSRTIKAPFLEPISNTMQSLLTAAQTVKKNKDDCTQMLDQIHKLLYAIIQLHISSDTEGELSPNILIHLGKFTQTLHKIHTFMEAHQKKSKILQFFRQGEMNTLLKACHLGLEQALEVFKVQNVFSSSDVIQMQQYAQKEHQEILDLISCLSDETYSDTTSTISKVLSASNNSSNSLSLLPSEPKIFYGRESELSDILRAFHQTTAKIAILGGGGMGKTSLARAVLHHPNISGRYGQNRVFVACHSTSTTVQLAALIGAHVGLKAGKDLTSSVVHYFSSRPPCLLVLDNLETLWEPTESRGEIEKFLALLADVDNLALIITMRGAERPANVQWTRPFLSPLKPLSQKAARETVITIVDDGYSSEEIDKILFFTENMPLAIDLIAHLVDCEGLSSVLNRWEAERTSLLSEGHDKGSNLDLSISLSLDSPRLTSVPHTRDLLSLLSILPDGISDIELSQSQIPIDNILTCRAALLQTSLAYRDDNKRLKVLVPIREYMAKTHPPMPHLIQPILKHFHKLLEVYTTSFGTSSAIGVGARIRSNLGNIQNILLNIHELNLQKPDLITAMYSTCDLAFYNRHSGLGGTPLMTRVSNVLPQLNDHRLEVYFIVEYITGHRYHHILNAEKLVAQALGHFTHFDDPDLKCRFYETAANYCQSPRAATSIGLQFCQTGLEVSKSNGNTERQSQLLTRLAWIQWRAGDYSAGKVYACEAQRLAKISGNFLREAHALHTEATCCIFLGSYSHSISLSNRARDLLGLCGMAGGELDRDIMDTLGDLHRLRSEYKEAHHIQMQILQNASREQEPYHYVLAHYNIAQIDVEVGTSREDVVKNIDTLMPVFKTTGILMGQIYGDMVRGALYLREKDWKTAKMLLQQCLRLVWGKHSHDASYCLERLGNFHAWGTMYRSSTWTMLFLVHSFKTKQKLDIHKAFQFLGDNYLADGDKDTAITLFTVALEGFIQMDVHRSQAECMLRLGDISKKDGDLERAVGLWKAARPLFERSSQTKQIALVEEKLASIPSEHIEEYD